MRVERFAVAVVIVCISVMLLSACGLPLLIPTRNPDIGNDNFVLIDRSTGPFNGRSLGSVNLDGSTGHLSGTLSLILPECAGMRQWKIQGAIVPNAGQSGSNAHLRLSSVAQETDGRLVLSGDVPAVGLGYNYTVLPFSGVIDVSEGCGAGEHLQVQALTAPSIYGEYWSGSTGKKDRIALVLTQGPIDAQGRFAVSARVSLQGPTCSGSGETSTPVPSGIASGPLTMDALMKDGSSLRFTLSTNYFGLSLKRRVEVEGAFAGGACKGQTFHARLRRD